MNQKNNTIRESLGDAAKRRNLQTVTLRGVTCYVRRMAALLLLAVMTDMTAWAQIFTGDNEWNYQEVNGGCILTGVSGTDEQKASVTTLTIPKTIDGKTVVGFSTDALSGFTGLTTIRFYQDASVETMPNVQNNTKFTTVLLINDNRATIEGGTNCLPASMTDIGNALKGTGITTLNMPNVTSIGYNAFEGCNSLTSVTFGKAAYIDNYSNAFSKIGSECKVYYPGPMTNWSGYVCQFSPNLVVEGTYLDNNVEKKWYCGWCGEGWKDSMNPNLPYQNVSCLFWTLDTDGNMVIDCLQQDMILDDYLWRQDINTTNWNNYSTAIKTVTMNHVDDTKSYAFNDSPNLTTVNISSHLSYIRTVTFIDCPNLKDLYFNGTNTQWANVGKANTWYYDVHPDFAAHWHCTVTFDANGHDTAPAAQNIQWSNKDKATRPADLSDDTYTFRGWFTDAACTKPWNFNTDIVPGDMTLYAGWKIRCTVTFDANGHGTAPAAQENLWSNEDKATEPDALSADGYVFTGWYTDAACTNKWNFGNVVPGDMTLYAGWTDNLVAATVTAEGAVDIPYGQEWTDVTVTVNSLTMGWFQNTGKVGRKADEMKLTPLIGSGAGRGIWIIGFSGHIEADQGVGEHTVDIDWSGYSADITASGQTAKVWIHIPKASWDAAAAGNYSRTMNIDAAFWCNAVSPAERYNVENVAEITFNLTVPEAVILTFDANGGTGDAMDAVNGRINFTTTLPACTYTAPTGKRFLSWNTKADGSGWRYYPGDDFIVSETTTLYAEWGGECEIDLTSVTEQVVTEAKWSLLTNLYGYYHYGDDAPIIDVNLDGKADLELLRPEWDFDLEQEVGDYAIKKLAGAAKLSGSYRFLMPTGSGEAYESVLIIFGSGATVQQPTITQLFDNDTDYPNDLVGLKDGHTRSIMIDDRTLYTDGDWNTLCLPFSVALDGSSLDGFTVKELDTETAYNGHVTGIEGSTLYLNFKGATSIEAGKPYIVKKMEYAAHSYTATNGTSGFNPSANLGYANLVDGNATTSWKPLFNNGLVFCEFHADMPVQAISYALTTSNATQDNPTAWTLKAKVNDAWTTIDSRDATVNSGDALSNSIQTPKNYHIQNPGTYQYYRFEVTGNSAGRASIGLAELSLQEYANITNPVFHGVTVNPAIEEIPNPERYSYKDPEYITAAVPGSVSFNGGQFCGNYKTRRFDAEDQSVLFLGAANTLYYPESGAKIGPFRSYFQLDTPAAVRAMVLGFGDDPASEETGIHEIVTAPGDGGDSQSRVARQGSAAQWYSLDGVRLQGKPTKKGLYIVGGRKVAIK